MKPAIVVALVFSSTVASARDAHVTALTRTTIYIDAGTADGLVAGATWQATIDGRAVVVRVAAVASHDAVLELEGPPPPVGAAIALPTGLAPPKPIAPRPPPAAMPAWHDDPRALDDVQLAAAHEQPAAAARPSDGTTIRGELALSLYVAADASNSSTSWRISP